MNGNIVSFVFLLILSPQICNAVNISDPLFTQHGVALGLGGRVFPVDTPCSFNVVTSSIGLSEAVDRALCGNPKSQEAWANIKAQTASVGISRAAYLPTVSASSQYVRDNSKTDVKGHPDLSSDDQSNVESSSISASWVLYDFGGRSAALKNANELLAVAQANQDSVLQTLLSAVAKDFYAVETAEQNLRVSRKIQSIANDSYLAASQRVKNGVAPITDELQAQTSLAQDVYDQSKAEGDLQDAIGTLASDLNLPPYTPLTLAEVDTEVQPDSDFSDSVVQMIQQAAQTHPDVIAAQAQVRAALAKKDQVEAEGMPSFNLTAKYSTNDQPASLGLGVSEFPATGRDWYVGVQVSIPIFEGFGRVYKVAQAQAQIEYQQDTLDEKIHTVSLDVWVAYHDLLTATQKVKNINSVFDIATQSFNAAKHRYDSGVGGILELLSSQNTLGSAEKQKIAAYNDWRVARLQLALKLGTLGPWWINKS